MQTSEQYWCVQDRDLAWRDTHQLHRLARSHELRLNYGWLQSLASSAQQARSHSWCSAYKPQINTIQYDIEYVQHDGRHDKYAIRWKHSSSLLAIKESEGFHELNPRAYNLSTPSFQQQLQGPLQVKHDQSFPRCLPAKPNYC